MNELDFFVTCVGIFKMAKPSRMNRHFEISETNDIKMVSKAWYIFTKPYNFHLRLVICVWVYEMGRLCLGVIHGTYNVTVIGPVSKGTGWSWPF